MRLVTWNINSVRLRLPLVMQLIDKQAWMCCGLQETKTLDEFFPIDAPKDKGFKHHHFHGYEGL